ncbi:MAG TPA: ABC transporter substrate binding protein, partial [Polyangia bacterium]|nr:ABC transporter substrate binding protein [Polyangia bacterium]
ALWLMPDPRLISAEMFNFLLVFTLEHKIALFGFLDSFTQAGALASIAPDYGDIGRRAARIAADLAQKPPEARLPVPPPVGAGGVLSVNAKTAKRLGLDIPPSALGKAKQVYR